ncbi:MAG: WhiB family transcriptional regulator [Acidimicrobiia bacterium]|nr:MAG: WhiB family transcriptional regulator [Acidimicrobiia bacterium]
MNDDIIDLRALAAPILEERPWAVFAACRETEADMFFGTNRDSERAALGICAICTVVEECLDHALGTRERFGVWGGATEKQRKRMLSNW